MVQALVLDDRFWLHVLAVVLPLLLMVLVAAVVYGLSLRGEPA
jgi:hypothetical protein